MNKDKNKKIVWVFFDIYLTTNIKHLSNKKQFSLLSFNQLNFKKKELFYHYIEINKPKTKEYLDEQFDLFLNNNDMTTFENKEWSSMINKVFYFPISYSDVYYYGVILNPELIQLYLDENVIKYTKKRLLFMEHNKSVKHNKCNLIKGVLNCHLNNELLDEMIKIKYKTENNKRVGIDLKSLLERLENYYYNYEWESFIE